MPYIYSWNYNSITARLQIRFVYVTKLKTLKSLHVLDVATGKTFTLVSSRIELPSSRYNGFEFNSTFVVVFLLKVYKNLTTASFRGSSGWRIRLLIRRSRVPVPGLAKKCYWDLLIIEMLNNSPEFRSWGLYPPVPRRKWNHRFYA